MSSSANVKSLERLEGFLEQCQRTRAHLLKELEALQFEIQRLTRWLENEALQYWMGALQQAQREWVEAEQSLLRCRSVVRESDRRPCTEQIKRLQVASERKALCERQVRFVRDATQMWQQEVSKLESKVFRCRDLAESELALAIHQLTEQLGRLHEYSSLRTGSVSDLKTDENESSLDTHQVDSQRVDELVDEGNDTTGGKAPCDD